MAVDDLAATDARPRGADRAVDAHDSRGRGLSGQQKAVFFTHRFERAEARGRLDDLNAVFLHTGRSTAFGLPRERWEPEALHRTRFVFPVTFPTVPAPAYDPPDAAGLFDRYADVLGEAFESGAVHDRAWAANGRAPAPTDDGLPDLQNLAAATVTVNALTAFEASIPQDARPEDLGRTLDAVFLDHEGRGWGTDLEAVYRRTDAIGGMQERGAAVAEAANLLGRGAVSDDLLHWLDAHDTLPFGWSDGGGGPDGGTGPGNTGGGDPTRAERLAELWRKWEAVRESYDESGEQFDAALDFGFGFVVGFKDGFVGTVEGAGSLLKGAWNAVKYVGTLPYRAGDAFWANAFGNGTDNYRREFKGEIEAAETAAQVAEQMAGLAGNLAEIQRDVIGRILAGDFDVFYDVSETFGVVIEASQDLFIELGIALLDEVGPEEVGKVFGQVVYEIAEGVVTAGVAKAAKVGKVAKLADKNLAVLKKLPGFGNKRVQTALDKVSELAWRLATTEMCFVAGTTVRTPDGPRPIESIRPGDPVYSRNDEGDETGPVTIRRVRETFVTRPDRLVRLSFRTPVGEEELTCTPQHPFFVPSLAKFVPAGDLAAGSAVALAGHGTAVVVARDVLRAEDGAAFTTYNFSVEGDRTYFVGDAGLWVHNTGTLCSRLAAKYWDDIWSGVSHTDAVDGVIGHLDKLVAKGDIFDVEANKHLGDVFNDLWRKVRKGEEDVDILGSQDAKKRVWDILLTTKDRKALTDGGGLRGKLIEDHLARTEYKAKGFANIGGRLRDPNFPLFDFENGNTLISLKTVDTNGGNWFSTMKKHIEALDKAKVSGQIATKKGVRHIGAGRDVALDIRVPPGQSTAAAQRLGELRTYATKVGITLNFKDFP